MDLQAERRLEQFVSLLRLPCSRVAERMEFVQGSIRLFVECAEQRIILSLARSVDAAHRVESLAHLLSRCDPVRTGGIVLRACVTRDYLILSGTLMLSADINDWLGCYRVMHRLLDTHSGEAPWHG